MGEISNPKNDRRSLTHTGGEVGSSKVTLTQNTANQNGPILEWECPRKFERIVYAGGRHYTKFRPRYKETFSGDGATTTFSLTGDVAPVHGEPTLDDQQFPAVVAYDSAASSELTVDSIDYAANDVTFASAPSSGTDNVEVWPILVEGEIQYRGLDQFGHEIAPLHEWGIPIRVFSDFNQDKNETQIHLVGAAQWRESETLAIYLDSPRQIVWTDTNYPDGQYVSTIEQRVDVDV